MVWWRARSFADLGVLRRAGVARTTVVGALVLGLIVASGCTAGRRWSPKWLLGQDFGDEGAIGAPSPAQREALREMGEDPSLSDRRRAAAWLRGALGLLPPTVMVAEVGTVDGWLERASALDREEGGPGAVARTLLVLLASLRSERSDHAAAVERATECREHLQTLDNQVAEARRELETLKAIDLTPMPGEPQP
jgi:hypothetical protein